MKTQMRHLLWILPGVLVAMGAYWVNAQDLSGMTTRDMLLKIRAMNADQMSQIVRSMDRNQMAGMIRSMDARTMSEIVRSLDPEIVTQIAKRISVELASMEPQTVVTTSRMCKSRLLRGNPGQLIVQAQAVDLGRQNRALDLDGQAPEGGQEDEMNLAGMAVLTHPSNPVNELTPEQIRRIYTGVYDNWNQVGGPDLRVQVIALAEMPAVQSKLTSNASVSPFVSAVFMGVADTSGAIGFVPQVQRRQLRFIGGHDAVRIMGVRIPGLIKSVGTAHSS
jgi:hypothetical protein